MLSYDGWSVCWALWLSLERMYLIIGINLFLGIVFRNIWDYTSWSVKFNLWFSSFLIKKQIRIQAFISGRLGLDQGNLLRYWFSAICWLAYSFCSFIMSSKIMSSSRVCRNLLSSYQPFKCQLGMLGFKLDLEVRINDVIPFLNNKIVIPGIFTIIWHDLLGIDIINRNGRSCFSTFILVSWIIKFKSIPNSLIKLYCSFRWTVCWISSASNPKNSSSVYSRHF